MKQLIIANNIRCRIEHPCTVAVVTPSQRCPFCYATGHQRHGVHFDHEWRCGVCNVTWEPGVTYLLHEAEDGNGLAQDGDLVARSNTA